MGNKGPGLLWLLALFVWIGACAALAQTVLDDTWTLTVAGQTVRVNPDGSFLIPNIATPDRFGAGGPGTAPDFLSDDFVRVVGFSRAGGITRYVFSEPFRIRQGRSFVVSELTVTLTPPPFPESLRAAADEPTLTALGQTTQIRVAGILPGGVPVDLTAETSWTVYRTSHPGIVQVAADGRATAVNSGTAFVTAVNEGATTVIQIDVRPGAKLTTLIGIVVGEDGAPVPGASVSLLGAAGSTVTDANGTFRIEGVARSGAPWTLLARVSTGARAFGMLSRLALSEAEFTDAGIVKVTPCVGSEPDCVDSDSDCVPDSIEVVLGLDPRRPDSNGNGILDGDEDPDGDRLSNCLEIAQGSNPRSADSDRDGLADGAEVFDEGTSPLRADTDADGLGDGDEVRRGTDPLRVDTDRDGWNDEAEVTGLSDPLDAGSRPPLMGVSGLNVGVIVANRSRSQSFEAGTILASPGVFMGLARLGDGAGQARNVTMALPWVSLGLTRIDSEQRGMTVSQPPLFIGIPAQVPRSSGLGSTTLGQPPIRIELKP